MVLLLLELGVLAPVNTECFELRISSEIFSLFK
jgi:hypothetical protein